MTGFRINKQKSTFFEGIRVASEQTKAAIKVGIGLAGDEILRRSNGRVPLDEATLQNSGLSEVPAYNRAVVSYNTPYAAKLHEHPEYKFQNGREGKWLENTLKQDGPAVLKIVAKQIKSEL